MSEQPGKPDEVLHDVVRVATDVLGARLIAVYVLGSLAHGGFSPAVSDVDVALVLTDPGRASDAESVARIADTVRAGGSPMHSRLSVFWGTPESLRAGAAEGRFPPLDRLCLSEHGRLLSGTDIRSGLARPDRTELLTAGSRFALDLLCEQVVATAGDPAALLAAGARPATKVVLFPARFLFTAATGREGTNEAAVQYFSAHQQGPAVKLVDAAFGWRASPPTGAAAALLDDGFVPLYDCYLIDHSARLRSVGEPALADRFDDWRSRLLAAGR